MEYFRFFEDELYGSCFENDDAAWLWHECDGRGYVRRFMLLLKDGRRCRYDSAHHTDQYGFLPDKPRTFDWVKTTQKERLSREQFDAEWNAGPWTNAP